MIDLHIALNDNLTLVSLYQRATEIQPQDPQLWGGLATTCARLGQKESARQAAAKVVEIDPNLLPQTEQFLKELEK